MMDWIEVEKTIFTYIATWTETAILWPGQAVRPTGETWIEPHIISCDSDFVGKTDKERATILVQIGIFSRSQNQYSLSSILKELSDFLHQKDLVSTNYTIRFGDLSSVPVYWRGSENTEKNLQYRACSITARIWEK
jgi:hypothetical protein